MNFSTLATDYDGTLAEDGGVSSSTIEALEALRRSGRRIILVTGRELDQLLGIFDRVDLFDRIVAENGALLYSPATRQKHLLTEAAPLLFVEELKRRGVSPISTGEAVVATWRPHENIVLQVIRELGLKREITFNKDAVMVLPPGVDKASGMKAALEAMKVSWNNVVGIGDAENDLAFLNKCRCSVAVSNALNSVKAHVNFTTPAPRGEGVVQLIREILKDDLQSRFDRVHQGQMSIPSPAKP